MNKIEKNLWEVALDARKYGDDPSRGVGCVIHSPDTGEIIVESNKMVYGANRGEGYEHRLERPHKYTWIEHAERGAIYKAASNGVSIHGWDIYCTYFPCVECTRAVIQSGIKSLTTIEPDFEHERWGESWKLAHDMMVECGIEIKYVKDEG